MKTKTWIFDEGKLEACKEEWVARQKATGHPVAIRNAEFVGNAILDFLHSSDKLFKVSEVSNDFSTARNVVPAQVSRESGELTESRDDISAAQPGDYSELPENFSIDDMKAFLNKDK